MQNLTFEVSDYGEGPEGQFIWGHERSIIFDRLYEAIDIIESGDTKKALNQLRSIIKRDPEFIDAYNSIGAYFFEKGNLTKGLEYYSKAYQIGQRVVPKGFIGQIAWIQSENRPFLRSMHGLGLCYIDLMQRDKTIEIFEKMLAYNPNDNQGVRYVIGDLYLQNKNHQASDKYFKDNLDYPPYRYSYGLSLFQQNHYIESIIQFWIGFYENIYILEYILELYPIIQYNCHHFSNYEMPEIANKYYSLNLGLWNIDKDIVRFLRVIYKSFLVQLGIKAIFERKKLLNSILSNSAEKIKVRSELIDEIIKANKMVNRQAADTVYNDMKKEFF